MHLENSKDKFDVPYVVDCDRTAKVKCVLDIVTISDFKTSSLILDEHDAREIARVVYDWDVGRNTSSHALVLQFSLDCPGLLHSAHLLLKFTKLDVSLLIEAFTRMLREQFLDFIKFVLG